jgi:hypothetical protein
MKWNRRSRKRPDVKRVCTPRMAIGKIGKKCAPIAELLTAA